MTQKLAIIFLFLGVGSAAFAYFWKSLTGTPQWYSRPEATEVSVQPISIDANNKINEVKSQLQQTDTADFKLSAQEINQLLASKAQDSNLQQIAPSLQTNVGDETLEIGTAINTSEIPIQDLTDEQKQIVEKALNIPQLNRQNIYVGIEGTPKAEAGKIRFDETSRIKVGTMSFSVKEVSQRLGVPPGEILKQLELHLDQLDVQDIELSDGEILFEVAPKNGG